MGAALSIFVILSLSVFVIRVASVALRVTGLADSSARFQALSAFTGTGFTTSEAESVVNYPVRRSIVSMLMIVGNMGLVTVLATLVVSLVRTDGDITAVVVQLGWLLGGLAVLWFLMLNERADRILCAVIGGVLESATFLGTRGFHRLLQVSDGYSVCEHPVALRYLDDNGGVSENHLAALDLVLLAIRSAEGESVERLVLFGPDPSHEAFSMSLLTDSPYAHGTK